MKRFSSYLLTHYPLIWNLRLHLIWPVIAAVHALFFTWGFIIARPPGMARYEHIRLNFDIVSLAILLAILIAVWWLVLYLRNNAFKSFLPLARGRLAGEALLIFVTALGLAGISISFSAGKSIHIRQMSAGINTTAERAIITQAECFLPFTLSDFSRFNNCDSTEHQAAADDSGRLPVDTFSYLHYCSGNYGGDDRREFPDRLSPREMRARAKRWLRDGDRDSVLQVLKQYLKLVKTYGGDYLFDPEAHVRNIFATPGFEIRYTISRYNLWTDNSEPQEASAVSVDELEGPVTQAPKLKYGEQLAYIEPDYPDAAISLIDAARSPLVSFYTWMFLLYAALTVTILLLSFRLTAVRPWFIALIGAGIWVVIIGLIAATFRQEEGMLTIILFLEALFTGLAVFGISSGWERRWAGVVYLWSFVGMPFFLPLLWLLIQESTQPEYSYDSAGQTQYVPAPFHSFMQTYQDLAMLLNVLVCIVLILVFYIPLARKWQAMPEE